jgi:tetratricopeptide (TPR) repeat protein
MQNLYPADESANNPYTLLAQVQRELKDHAAERAALEKLAELTDDDVEMFARLSELTLKAEDWEGTRKHALRWLAVNPLVPTPHRAAAAAAEALKDDAMTIDSYRALLLLEPFDPAGIHLKLATALERQGDLAIAKRHALLALEETPRYRAAHQQLLAIVRRMSENAKKNKDDAPTSPSVDPFAKPAAEVQLRSRPPARP